MSEFIALFRSVPYLIISVLLLKTMISIYISVYITCLHATTPFWVKLVKEHKNTKLEFPYSLVHVCLGQLGLL